MIIDSQGKLFGKINVVDFAAMVCIIVALLVGMKLVFGDLNINFLKMGSVEKMTQVDLVVYDLYQEQKDNLVIGDTRVINGKEIVKLIGIKEIHDPSGRQGLVLTLLLRTKINAAGDIQYDDKDLKIIISHELTKDYFLQVDLGRIRIRGLVIGINKDNVLNSK